MLLSVWCCIQPNSSSEEVRRFPACMQWECLFAQVCQLTLICLISSSKSLTSPHANKHIHPLSNQSHYQTLVWSAEGLRGSSLCIWIKCPAPALQGEKSLLPDFDVIALTFSSDWEQLPPQQTGVCLWAGCMACYCRLGIYCTFTLP